MGTDPDDFTGSHRDLAKLLNEVDHFRLIATAHLDFGSKPHRACKIRRTEEDRIKVINRHDAIEISNGFSGFYLNCNEGFFIRALRIVSQCCSYPVVCCTNVSEPPLARGGIFYRIDDRSNLFG